ncbi:MAG: hypothetical protein LBN05_05980 [Oscillospiraceae bacterium]|nr:hypothetical protein [Oscillospiraceae bacterium]
MRLVGKIDREKFKAVSEHITTDEVVITDERIAHIEQRHPGAYERFSPYIQEILSAYDIMLEDKHPHTALLIKKLEKDGAQIELVLRLHTLRDETGYKNSVLSLWEISDRRLGKYLRNRRILDSRL